MQNSPRLFGKIHSHFRVPGWLRWLRLQLLVSTQIMSLGSRDLSPYQALHSAQSLFGVLSPSLPAPPLPFPWLLLTHVLSLSNILKNLFFFNVWSFLHSGLPPSPAIPFLGIYPQEIKTFIHKKRVSQECSQRHTRLTKTRNRPDIHQWEHR